MKSTAVLFFCLLFSNLFSEELSEKKIETEVQEVTVFLDGAQILRQKKIELTKGKTLIKFVNLSPFIDAKSIQVKAEGALTVLSVNHQHNYLDKSEKSAELTNLEKQLDAIDEKINLEQTYLSIIREELAFLQQNRDIGGKNEQVNVSNLQLAADFYGNNLTALKLKEIERNKTLADLQLKRADIQNQISTLTGKKEYPSGEILVKADVKQTGSFNFELSYLVENAGWFPSYDIRAKNINDPIVLTYKANVKQNTKVDWKNVKLKFSSADPNVSGVAPELLTYYLNYNMLPPVYKNTNNMVRGKITGHDGRPLPGANVKVDGTTIGTVADQEGNYSISIPNNATQLTFTHLGCVSQTRQISGDVINVSLFPQEVQIEEMLQGRIGNDNVVSVRDRSTALSRIELKSNMKTTSIPIPITQTENQTTVDFEIKTPYSIKSDNNNYQVEMDLYELPAFYQYYCVPKIDKDAFLIANIVDWEKYNLLEGEANIFFEDTYVGKSILDVRYVADTLEISLGRDKSVMVNREKVKDFTNRQFIGNKKEESRAWKTTVRNNKSQDINMIVLDQVPVSTLEEIEVSVQDVSGGRHNLETGEIKWEFTLKPNAKKELDLKYSVKYPKNRNLIIE